MLAAIRRASSRAATALKAEQQLRQLGDIGRNPLRLVFAEQLGGRAATGFVLIISVAQRLTIGVTHDETVWRDFGRPRWWEATLGHGWLSARRGPARPLQ
jgi:hypothetical protein